MTTGMHVLEVRAKSIQSRMLVIKPVLHVLDTRAAAVPLGKPFWGQVRHPHRSLAVHGLHDITGKQTVGDSASQLWSAQQHDLWQMLQVSHARFWLIASFEACCADHHSMQKLT